MEKDRKTILLKAAYDLLKKCEDSSYVLEAPAVLVKYDGVFCDGSCLKNDIADELGIEED